MQDDIRILAAECKKGQYTITRETFQNYDSKSLKALAKVRRLWRDEYPSFCPLRAKLLEAKDASSILDLLKSEGIDDPTLEVLTKLCSGGLNFFLSCLLAPPELTPDPTQEQLQELASRLPYELFRTQLYQAQNASEIKALFGGDEFAQYFAKLWEDVGPAGVLLRIPAWEPPGLVHSVLRLRLLESWQTNSKFEKALKSWDKPIKTESQLRELLDASGELDFYSTADIREMMKIYPGDLCIALRESFD